ncbi:MAG TPA: hypothetical protein VKC54_01905 [Patescibacteria group bacterium]|nr:hypothetical protein [Patescibacteria group bacterium]
MENEKSKQQVKTEKWYAPYLVVSLTWGLAASFRSTDIGVIVVLIVAIAAGIFYRRVKTKVKSTILAVILIEVIAAVLIGSLTAITNRLF